MEEHQDIIVDNFKYVGYKNELIIDTEDFSVDDAVNLIIEKVKEIRNANR